MEHKIYMNRKKEFQDTIWPYVIIALPFAGPFFMVMIIRFVFWCLGYGF